MLSMSDVNIDQFIPLFSDIGVSVAFLVPTPTGYDKSIMDAIGSVRELLKDESIHDYELQGQGPAAKIMWPSYFVTADGLIETEASLYRPVTKKGDPRIWFKNLRQYCSPKNLLSLFIYENKIYGKDWEDKKLRLQKGNNPDFWISKIERNMQRDHDNDQKLMALGWTVIHFWGEEIKKNLEDCVRVIEEAIFEKLIEDAD